MFSSGLEALKTTSCYIRKKEFWGSGTDRLINDDVDNFD